MNVVRYLLADSGCFGVCSIRSVVPQVGADCSRARRGVYLHRIGALSNTVLLSRIPGSSGLF